MPKAESYLNYSSSFAEKAFLWPCYLLVFGLFFSRAVLSISGVLILIAGLASFYHHQEKKVIKLDHLLFLLIYLGYLFSFFWTENINIWKEITYKNSFLFIIPVGFLFAPKLSFQKIKPLLFLFAFFCFLLISLNTIYALLNFGEFLNAISNSKNFELSFGPDHSGLGVLSTISLILLYYLWKIEKTKIIKLILIITLITMFAELHIIAYRFSLVCFYIIAIIYLLKLILLYKKWSYVIGLASVFMLAFALYLSVPSLQKRYQNTFADLQSINQNKNPNYQSLGQRWAAIKCSWKVIKKHPMIGTSPADAGLAMKKEYANWSYLLIPENRIYIHNQILSYAISFGVPFTLLFLFLLFQIILKTAFHNQLSFWLILPFIFHMMIENTLEKQITANAFIFLLLLLANTKSEKIS